MRLFDTIKQVQDMKIIPYQRMTGVVVDDYSKSPQEWYEERMEYARTVGPYCYPFPEMIDEERAKFLLNLNPDNRSLKKTKGDEMRSALLRGQWKLNGETIIVAIDGLLNDGQNRLTAVQRTQVPINTFVVWGVERDSRRTVDIGSTRLPGDFIAMEGGADGNHLAALSKWILMYQRGIYKEHSFNAKVPLKTEVTSFWLQNKEEIESAFKFVRVASANTLRATTSLGVCYFLARRKSPAEADQFFLEVCQGAGFALGTPQHMLRNRLMSEASKKRGIGEKIELILRGWKFYRHGIKKPGNMPINGEYIPVE